MSANKVTKEWKCLSCHKELQDTEIIKKDGCRCPHCNGFLTYIGKMEDDYLIPKDISEIMCILFPLLIMGSALMNYLPGLACFILLVILLRIVYLWGKRKGKEC